MLWPELAEEWACLALACGDVAEQHAVAKHRHKIVSCLMLMRLSHNTFWGPRGLLCGLKLSAMCGYSPQNPTRQAPGPLSVGVGQLVCECDLAWKVLGHPSVDAGTEYCDAASGRWACVLGCAVLRHVVLRHVGLVCI